MPASPGSRPVALLAALASLLLLGAGCTSGGQGRARSAAGILSGEEAGVRVCRRLAPLSSGTCSAKGSGDALLLRGTVLTPDEALVGGEVLISSRGVILSVGCDTKRKARGLELTVVECPEGILSPGLINSHDHLTYDQNSPGNWGTERYDHRHQWRKGLDGHTKIPAPRANDDLQVAWAELRQAMSGTTSVLGSGGHRGLLRNLDMERLREGLTGDATFYNTFPLGDFDGVMLASGCAYPKIDGTEVLRNSAYLPHVAEGLTAAARNEFLCLSRRQAGGRDLLARNSNFVHMLGTLAPDVGTLARQGASVVWSPRSNIALYGNTLAARLFATLGVNLSLSSDWTPSGSAHLLRELRCAADFNAAYLDGFFTDRDLWQMVTGAPADALDLEKRIGRLASGRLADIAIFDGRGASNPYRAVLDAGTEDVALVLRGGIPLSGDSELVAALPQGEGCEALPEPVCGRSKAVCLQREIGAAFSDFAAANGSAYPLYFCGTPPGEPTCVPSRPGEYTGQPAPDDPDGDGLADSADNCPRIFNPVRPLDAGAQADWDQDGQGDACDSCPLGDCEP